MGAHALSNCRHSTELLMSWHEDYDLLYVILNELENFLQSQLNIHEHLESNKSKLLSICTCR